ncbi:MAG: hypothetical protein JRN68_06685 [Nitrososphaerota archaeon]|nr:hypothetical protein [Nitrososphaerota archaeon]
MPFGDFVPAKKSIKILAAREASGMTVILAYDTREKEYYLDIGRGRLQLCFTKEELDGLAALFDDWRSASS